MFRETHPCGENSQICFRRRARRPAYVIHVALLITLSASGAGRAACPELRAPRDYPVLREPRVIVTEDFNADGRPDLAVLNAPRLEGPELISILLNAGGSENPIITHLDVGSRTPATLSSGDFNGDGKADLVGAASGSYQEIRLLLGNGDGTFAPPILSPSGSSHSVASVAAHLDSDGFLDLAVVGLEGISVYQGRGDGTFGPRSLNAGSNWRTIGVADVNGDQRRDLIAGGVGLAILLGNGDGTFAPALQSLETTVTDDIVAADFDGDSDIDLATSAGGTDVVVLLGDGKGTFSLPARYPVTAGAPFWALASADFNKDGALDVVATFGPGSTSEEKSVATILFGDGRGGFPTSSEYLLGSSPWSVAILDHDGDSHLDIAVVSVNFASVTILLGEGDGRFIAPARYDSDATAVEVADVDGDGRKDFILKRGQYGSTNRFGVMVQNPNGSFEATGSHEGGLPYAAVLGLDSADFNSDGKIDVAVVGNGCWSLATAGGLAVRLGVGDGSFGEPKARDLQLCPVRVFAVELNGDGRADVLVTGSVSGNPGAARFVLSLLGQGDGTFRDGFFYNIGDPSPVIADLNGDGILDLAAPHDSERVAIALGQGDGSFVWGSISTFPSADVWAVSPVPIAAGDFTGDGRVDLLVRTRRAIRVAPNYYTQGPDTVAVLPGSTTGSLLGDPRFHAPTSALYLIQQAETGDFDGDGLLDVVIRTGDLNVHLFLGNGDGTFKEPKIYYTGDLTTTWISAFDLNDDRYTDFVTTSSRYSRSYLSVVTCSVSNAAGDMDGDFDVDAADLNAIIGAFRTGYGSVAPAPQDCTGDGVLTGADVLCVENILQPLGGAQTSVLDLDRTGSSQPLTDGLLLLRKLFGFSGSTLVQGAVGTGAARTNATEIAMYSNRMALMFDVDGDGVVQPLSDGLLVLRYLFGFRGQTLISGAIGSGATRTTAAEIEAYLTAL